MTSLIVFQVRKVRPLEATAFPLMMISFARSSRVHSAIHNLRIIQFEILAGDFNLAGEMKIVYLQVLAVRPDDCKGILDGEQSNLVPERFICGEYIHVEFMSPGKVCAI